MDGKTPLLFEFDPPYTSHEARKNAKSFYGNVPLPEEYQNTFEIINSGKNITLYRDHLYEFEKLFESKGQIDPEEVKKWQEWFGPNYDPNSNRPFMERIYGAPKCFNERSKRKNVDSR